MKYLRVLLGAFLGAVITFAAPLAHAEFLEYKAKAESGDAAAQCNLARCYLNGEGVGKDGEQAEKWFRKAAEQGLADGQNGLGVCYRSGKGVAKDEVEAVKWFRKAADQGFAKAEFNLGVCYAFGQGVSQNAVGAVKWFRKAADQGFAEGQNSLGVCYFKGEGVDKDVVEALKWFRKSAEQGNPNGQLKLGSCYAFGQGVDENEVEAVKWFRKAAEQGVAIAQYNLGNCYDEGHGVAKDKVEAVKWYKKAAEQGQSDGQLNLAIAYYSGEGVTKNEVDAVKWFRKAAEQGQQNAKVALDEIEKEKLENGGVRQQMDNVIASLHAQEKANDEALAKRRIENENLKAQKASEQETKLHAQEKANDEALAKRRIENENLETQKASEQQRLSGIAIVCCLILSIIAVALGFWVLGDKKHSLLAKTATNHSKNGDIYQNFDVIELERKADAIYGRFGFNAFNYLCWLNIAGLTIAWVFTLSGGMAGFKIAIVVWLVVGGFFHLINFSNNSIAEKNTILDQLHNVITHLQYKIVDVEGKKIYWIYKNDEQKEEVAGFVTNPKSFEYWKIFFKGQEITIDEDAEQRLVVDGLPVNINDLDSYAKMLLEKKAESDLQKKLDEEREEAEWEAGREERIELAKAQRQTEQRVYEKEDRDISSKKSTQRVQIGSVSQTGNLIAIFDSKGSRIGSIGLGSKDRLQGYTSTTVTVKTGNGICNVYDERGSRISSHF